MINNTEQAAMPYGDAGEPPGRSLASFKTLHPAEERLFNSAIKGKECIVSRARPNASQKSPENLVRADFIRFLALGGEPGAPVHEHGVQLTGAYVEGVLDLMGCKNLRSLFLRSCWFDGDLMLRDAQTQTINLDGSRVAGFDAKRAEIKGSVYLRHDDHLSQAVSEADEGPGCFESGKGLNIVDAEITGSLECHNAHFGVCEGKAIFASRADIGGSVFLHQSFAAEGPIIFRGATIGGNFECSGGRFQAVSDNDPIPYASKAERSAISCEGADIRGSVYFHEYDASRTGLAGEKIKKPFTAFGEVRFIDAEIGGSFECHGARITNPGGYALYCSRMSVSGSVFLHEHFEAKGEVIFRRATIGGNFECSTGKFTADNTKQKEAISCKGAHIAGSLFLRDIAARGQLSFIDARIDGSFECHGARIENYGDVVLYCSRLKVNGSVLIHEGFSSVGEISFRRADIRGNLDASKTVLLNSNGKALSCECAHITGSVRLCSKFTAQGEVDFTGAEIESDFHCDGGKFESPDGRALTCERTTIKGRVSLGDNFLALGAVSFASATIDDDFICLGGRFINPTPRSRQGDENEAALCSNALNLRNTNIGGVLWLAPSADGSSGKHACIRGSLDLRDAKLDVLMDDKESWPQKSVIAHCWIIEKPAPGPSAGSEQTNTLLCHIYLDGCAYNRLGGGESAGTATRILWLRRQPAIDLESQFKPQPFEQLVKVFRNMGHTQAAHIIAIEKERHHRRQPTGRWPWKLLMLAFDWVAGYGYRSHRVVFAAIVIWLFCAGVYKIAAEQGVFVPKDPAQACGCISNCTQETRKECPDFSAFAYSLDVMLPFDLHHENVWEINWKKNQRISILPPEWRSSIFFNFRDLDKVTFPTKYVDLLRTLEIIFGWFVGVILVALLGRKMNRE